MANDERCARCGHARHDHRNGRAIRGVGGVDGEMCWACYDDECSRGAWKGTYIHAFALAPAPTPSPDTPMIEDCSHSFVHLLGGYRCTRCGTQMVHTADTCDECRRMTSPDTQREEELWECPRCGVAKKPQRFSETEDCCLDCAGEQQNDSPVRGPARAQLKEHAQKHHLQADGSCECYVDGFGDGFAKGQAADATARLTAPATEEEEPLTEWLSNKYPSVLEHYEMDRKRGGR